MRQRFDEDAKAIMPLVDDANVDFIQQSKAPVSALTNGWVSLDIDVFPMDNSQTKKEGVSRTYKGHDGYAPIAAYLGLEGWCIGIELREGHWHCQKEFNYVLERMLPRARKLVKVNQRIMLRLDSGHDAQENREALVNDSQIDFLIKWNPSKQDLAHWIKETESLAGSHENAIQWTSPREGKRIAIYSQNIEETYQNGPQKGQTYTVRRVIRITERTIDKQGQSLILPDIHLEGWWTTIDEEQLDNQTIIKCYQDHATSEQYHSEFKTTWTWSVCLQASLIPMI